MGTVRKLVVEVIEARNLLPKDGHDTSSPYVLVDFYGQRIKTRTVTRDLSPQWNEMLEFYVGKSSDVFGTCSSLMSIMTSPLAPQPGKISLEGSG